MNKMISRFPEQLAEAMEIGRNMTIQKHNTTINKAFVAGMGGSGIGANFVAGFIRAESKIPYLVGKAYDIPAYIDGNTLAILSSYSGNTEETLSALSMLEETECKIVCIASGGKLIERAKEKGYDYVQVPSNWSSPRACLGYSIVQQLYILKNLDIISSRFEKELEASIELINSDVDEIKSKAVRIAQMISSKTPVIYSTDNLEAVAVRFRQQINENGKMLAWHHLIPEMNHNELVGWKEERNDIAVLVLRDKKDFIRNQTRIEINKEIISKLSASWIEIFAKGNSLIEKSFYLVHLVDWISWELSVIRKVDAVEIDCIDFLKSELAKQPF